MADRFSREVRSRIMSKIRSTSKLEISFRKKLWANGVRNYRKEYQLPGKPDLTFVKAKTVVFIDGDFWHGYTWKKLGRAIPKQYWQRKICKNIERDKKNNTTLRKMGWRIIRVWEHEIKLDTPRVIGRIKQALTK